MPANRSLKESEAFQERSKLPALSSGCRVSPTSFHSSFLSRQLFSVAVESSPLPSLSQPAPGRLRCPSRETAGRLVDGVRNVSNGGPYGACKVRDNDTGMFVFSKKFNLASLDSLCTSSFGPSYNFAVTRRGKRVKSSSTSESILSTLQRRRWRDCHTRGMLGKAPQFSENTHAFVGLIKSYACSMLWPMLMLVRVTDLTVSLSFC